MEWTEDNRAYYIRTSIGMAGLIASENDEEQADCLENWYFSDPEQKNEFIYGYMVEYPSHHPRGIILAVLQKQCGSFNYVDR